MKTENPIKVRVISSKEEFYTFKSWPEKTIEGTTFIGVNKFVPTQDKTQIMYWLRKDSLEYPKQ